MPTPRQSPPDMLASIGRALYGTYWQRALAAALGVHERQLRRWLTGESPLAAEHGVFPEALALLTRRETEIGAQARRLAAWSERHS